MMEFTCTKDVFRIIHGREQVLIQIVHQVTIISLIINYGNIFVVCYTLWLMNHISKIEQSSALIILASLINGHIIQHYNIPQSNLPEEPR